MKTSVAAFGAFLLTYGLATIAAIPEIFPFGQDNSSSLLAILGVVAAAVGATILVYGIGARQS